MYALRYDRFGSPSDVLRYAEVPPRPIAAGEVRLRMTHRPINPADLLEVRGRYGVRPELPAVAGHEGVGIVEAVGDGVTGWAEGDRAVPLAAGPTWQTHLTTTPDRLFRAPDAVPDAAAAQLFVNPVTAALLLDLVGAPAGSWLLCTAANAAVARFALQLGHAAGLRVLGLSRRPDALPDLDALGYDAAVAFAEGDDPAPIRREILDVTGGIAGALDPVGGDTGALAASCLTDGGVLAVYGALSGSPIPLAPGPLLFRQATVRGLWRTQWWSTATPSIRTQVLGRVASAFGEGRLHAPVEAEYALADFSSALAHHARSGRMGKVLLTS